MRFKAIVEVNVPELEASTDTEIEDELALEDVVVQEFMWLKKSGITLQEIEPISEVIGTTEIKD